MHPTPGVVYIARTLPLAFTHLALVYTLIHAVGSQYFRVPSWFIPFVYVLSALLVIGFCLLLTDFKEERKAVARGAVLPRQVHYKYILTPRGPPGARFLGTHAERLGPVPYHDKTFPGYNLFNWSDEYGPLFRFRVWGEHIVCYPIFHKHLLLTNERRCLLQSQNTSRQGARSAHYNHTLKQFHLEHSCLKLLKL